MGSSTDPEQVVLESKERDSSLTKRATGQCYSEEINPLYELFLDQDIEPRSSSKVKETTLCPKEIVQKTVLKADSCAADQVSSTGDNNKAEEGKEHISEVKDSASCLEAIEEPPKPDSCVKETAEQTACKAVERVAAAETRKEHLAQEAAETQQEESHKEAGVADSSIASSDPLEKSESHCVSVEQPCPHLSVEVIQETTTMATEVAQSSSEQLLSGGDLPALEDGCPVLGKEADDTAEDRLSPEPADDIAEASKEAAEVGEAGKAEHSDTTKGAVVKSKKKEDKSIGMNVSLVLALFFVED